MEMIQFIKQVIKKKDKTYDFQKFTTIRSFGGEI